MLLKMYKQEFYTSIIVLLIALALMLIAAIKLWGTLIIGFLVWCVKLFWKFLVLIWHGIVFVAKWLYNNIIKPIYETVIKPAALAIWGVLKSIWKNLAGVFNWGKGIVVDLVDEAKDLGGKGLDEATKFGVWLLGIIDSLGVEYFGTIGSAIAQIVEALGRAAAAVLEPLAAGLQNILSLVEPVLIWIDENLLGG